MIQKNIGKNVLHDVKRIQQENKNCEKNSKSVKNDMNKYRACPYPLLDCKAVTLETILSNLCGSRSKLTSNNTSSSAIVDPSTTWNTRLQHVYILILAVKN